MVAEDKLFNAINIPGYTLKEKLGRSGYCTHIRAHQELLVRDVLIKLAANRNKESLQALQQEVRLKFSLQSELAAGAIDEGDAGPFHYWVVELSEGETLAGLQHLKGPEMVSVIRQLFQFLAQLHDKGHCLCACLPQDFRITPEGHVRVLNLEYAVKGEDSRKKLKLVKGMEVFLAPEVLTGKVCATVRSDLFLMAAVCYYGATGALPYGEGPPKKLLRRMTQRGLSSTPTANRVPKPLLQILTSMLSPKPIDRPKNAMAVLEKLDAMKIQRGPSVHKRAHPRPLPLGLALGVIALAVAVGTFVIVLNHQDPPPKNTPTTNHEQPVKPVPDEGKDPPVNPQPLPDPGDKDAPKVAQAFNLVLKENEARAEDWLADIQRLEAYVKLYPDSPWAGRARSMMREKRSHAEQAAQEALNKLSPSPGVSPVQLIEHYRDFVKQPAYQGTEAAGKARQKETELVGVARQKMDEAFKKADASCQQGRFDEALDVLAGAASHVLPEAMESWQNKKAGVGASKAAWNAADTRFNALMKLVRSQLADRRFNEALATLLSQGAEFNRPALASEIETARQVCRVAALAMTSLMEEAQKAVQEKRALMMAVPTTGSKQETMPARFVSVSPKTFTIKPSGRTSTFDRDPMALSWANLLRLTASGWTDKTPVTEAILYLMILTGNLDRAETLLKTVFPAGKTVPPLMRRVLENEKKRAAHAVLDEAAREAEQLLEAGRYGDAEKRLATIISRYAGTASFKMRRQSLQALYGKVYSAVKKAGGLEEFFNAPKVTLGRHDKLILEYAFKSQKELLDWRPDGSRGEVQFEPAKGMRIKGRVLLMGPNPLFIEWLRVDGCAAALSESSPNCNIELWGSQSDYGLLFGFGFEDDQLPLAFEGQGRLYGPENVLLAKLGKADTWQVLYHGLTAETKLIPHKFALFTMADLKGDLHLHFNGRQMLNIPRAVLDRRWPEWATQKPQGTVVLDTRASPVIFRSLAVTGKLNPGWLELALKEAIQKAFDGLCNKKG